METKQEVHITWEQMREKIAAHNTRCTGRLHRNLFLDGAKGAWVHGYECAECGSTVADSGDRGGQQSRVLGDSTDKMLYIWDRSDEKPAP